MLIIISILLIIFALFNTYCIFMIRQLRNSLKKLFESKYGIQNKNFKILYELSNDNPLLREYVIYNAPIFVFPFAAIKISSLNSLIQIISVLIFIFSLFKFNLVFLVLSIVIFFLSGYSGSRFNKKRMFNEAILNFSKKVPPYNKDYFYTLLSEFHQQYLLKIAENNVPSYSTVDTGEFSGEYEENIEKCNEAIRKNPKDINLRNVKGAIFYKWGKYEEAIRAFDEAIKLNPKDVAAYNFKGLALIKQSRYTEAINTFNEVIKLDPNNFRAHCDKALAISELGNYEEAINILDKAIKTNPKNTEPYFNKGVCLEKLGKYKEAADMFNEVIKIDPKDTGANNYKVLMLDKLSKRERK